MRLHEVLISSLVTELVMSQPFAKKISKIHLYWGCLAAGIKVAMTDGMENDIESLLPGDALLSPDGGTVMVQCLISGMEENIYRLRMENGMEVLASQTHPLGMQEGFTAPIDLASQTRLMTRQGLSDVLYCYPETYRGAVYVVELEEGVIGREDNVKF